jgi:hypothetical protein
MPQRADGAFERLALAPELLRALVVAPDFGIFYELDDFRQALRSAVEVKDTSAARPYVLRRPGGAWR